MKRSKEDMTMAQAREYCLRLERMREHKRRQSEQGKFESSFESYDMLVEQYEDPSKIAAFSDGGAGVEQINRIDEDPTTEWNRRKKWALNKVRCRPDLQKTLRLIIRNGNNREESIWELAKKR